MKSFNSAFIAVILIMSLSGCTKAVITAGSEGVSAAVDVQAGNVQATVEASPDGTVAVKGIEVTVPDIIPPVYFDFDSSIVRTDDIFQLMATAEALKRVDRVSLTVEGHADSRGTNEYNQVLGQRRAQAVKNYLVMFGVNTSQIETVSYGEEKLKCYAVNNSAIPGDESNDPEFNDCHAANRRVEFTVKGEL